MSSIVSMTQVGLLCYTIQWQEDSIRGVLTMAELPSILLESVVVVVVVAEKICYSIAPLVRIFLINSWDCFQSNTIKAHMCKQAVWGESKIKNPKTRNNTSIRQNELFFTNMLSILQNFVHDKILALFPTSTNAKNILSSTIVDRVFWHFSIFV